MFFTWRNSSTLIHKALRVTFIAEHNTYQKLKQRDVVTHGEVDLSNFTARNSILHKSQLPVSVDLHVRVIFLHQICLELSASCKIADNSYI